MQLPNLSVLALATILAFGDTAPAARSCSKETNDLYQTYTVRATGVGSGKIPAVCGGLWSNLRRFGSCTVTRPFCGSSSANANNLKWKFNVPWGCNSGMVHSAWWEATENKWGGVVCPA